MLCSKEISEGIQADSLILFTRALRRRRLSEENSRTVATLDRSDAWILSLSMQL